MFGRRKRAEDDPISVDANLVLEKVQTKIDELNAASNRLERASKKASAVNGELQRNILRATELARKPIIRNS
jgi:hypothetical protein